MTGRRQSVMDLFGKSAPASMFPSPSELDRGEQMAVYNKYPVVVTGYFVDMFDMSIKADRERYSKLMLELFKKVQALGCTLCRNELQSFDGTWKRYIEWFEFKKNDAASGVTVEGGSADARQ